MDRFKVGMIIIFGFITMLQMISMWISLMQCTNWWR